MSFWGERFLLQSNWAAGNMTMSDIIEFRSESGENLKDENDTDRWRRADWHEYELSKNHIHLFIYSRLRTDASPHLLNCNFIFCFLHLSRLMNDCCRIKHKLFINIFLQTWGKVQSLIPSLVTLHFMTYYISHYLLYLVIFHDVMLIFIILEKQSTVEIFSSGTQCKM